ncbi:MAG TPA: hypothetical protein VE263_00765 [Candidatus Angelobacter sp.]|nr:hypothetical protein [Candidatus Angelobacter sp.]
MLSDHIFHLFGRTITVTSQEQFMLIVVLAIGVTAWVIQQFRRRRVVVLHRSAVSDQLLYELSRIADSLDRIANHPADQVIAAVNQKAEESRPMSFSLLGKLRPHN